MKAYGYPLTPDNDDCIGIVVDEHGNFLGTHISSNYSFLKMDLASHAKGYEFEFVDFIPGAGFAISVLLNEINRLKEQLGE